MTNPGLIREMFGLVSDPILAARFTHAFPWLVEGGTARQRKWSRVQGVCALKSMREQGVHVVPRYRATTACSIV
jgi:hypothetical protein